MMQPAEQPPRTEADVPLPTEGTNPESQQWSNTETLVPESRPGAAEAGTGPVGEAFGGYDLVGEIARGGMGVVYKAFQRSLQRTVALKMILDGRLASDDAVQRFYQEARAAAGLDHPNIVSIYEVGEHNGRHYFTMALVDGPSLASVVRHKGLPEAAEAAAIVAGVAEAVAHAHAQGIIHRDLKPDNVLLDRSGRPRVTDFGLAKSLTASSGMTASGQILGTPSYMAPEQAMGDTRIMGPATDVYALGGILYFLLTGKPPFAGGNVMTVLHQVLHDPPEPPRRLNANVPAELEAICLKCLAKDPGQRYASAGDVAQALRPLATLSGWQPPSGIGSGPMAPPTQNPVGGATQPTPTSRRRRLLPAAVAVLGLALVAVGGYFAYARWGKPAGGPGEDPVKESEPVLVPKITHRDFDLKVELLGATPANGGDFQLLEGQPVTFRIQVARTAYVGLWNITPDGKTKQFFPNDYESDNRVEAGKPRTIPNEEYQMTAQPGGVEQFWVVASTKPWSVPVAEKEGPFAIFRSVKDVRRKILLVPVSKGLAAEAVLKYRVKPAAGRSK